MPITYTIDSEKKLITEVWTGEVGEECLAAYWKQYLEDSEVLATRRTLVDLRHAHITFSGSDLDSLIKTLVLPALNGKDWKTAIVVEKPAQYGVSRQYQVFARHYSKDAIFHSMEAAHSWLTGLPD